MNNLKSMLAILGLLLALTTQSQITINFCPVTKTQATPKGFSATMDITNNTGQVLDFANNDFNMNWPSLISLPWPFSDGVQNGINWDFKINLDWPGTLAVGSTSTVQVSNALFSGALQFPTGGTYTEGGTTYTVTVNHCNSTEAYELYDETYEFNRDCFIKSPTSNMCLGEAGLEVWQGEGVFDAMVPTDRPSWAIAVMVAHRLFTNLVGVEMATANFWTATALNESRMVCDPTIVPNVGNHWPINSIANSGTGVDTRTDNCFQVLNIGFVQLQNNQPDLFSQTNAYGTANFNNVIAGGRWETGALAVTHYHSQNIKYWNQIQCLNLQQVHKDAVDPYATEKILYHAFHDGFNSGTTLIQDIRGNYNAAVNAPNMNTVIGTGGTWSNLGGGSSQKVANFTSLLEGGSFNLYPTNRADQTHEYYGCYQGSISWNDVLFYLDKIKILYPRVLEAAPTAAIKAVFDGLNGGGNVNFTNLGPVIDEIVIQMGGHDPSSYLATQYSASQTCNNEALEVTLKTNDTLCPGESGFLQVWLAGTPDFEVDIKFPDGTINKYTGINSSPYNVPITQPGDYEVVYLEDAIKVGDVNCNVAKVTVESKNGSVVGWDKSNVDAQKNCSTGDLIITKTGSEQVTISYTLDGVAQTDEVMTANETSKTIGSNVIGGQYIITTISPNSCGVPINDTISFCNDACTKPPYEILTPDTSICAGDTAQVRVAFDGTQPYTLYFTPNGLPQVTVPNITDDFYTIPVSIAGTFTIDSLVDNTCTNDTSKSLTITIDALPVLDLGNDTTLCSTSLTLDGGVFNSYEWQENAANSTQTYAATTTGSNDYILKVTNAAGCEDIDTINVTLNPSPTAPDLRDTAICAVATPFTYDATTANATYEWSDGSTNPTLDVSATGDYWVAVTVNGCSDTDSVALTVSPGQALELGNDTTLCGTSLQLDARAGFATYQWNGNAADNGQTLTVNTSGKYYVDVTTNDGCSSADTIDVTINPIPTVDIGNDTSYCSNDVPATYDATTAGAAYLWSDNSTNPTLDLSATGDYWVIVTVNGCSDSDSVSITVNPTPVVALGNDTSICGTSFMIDAGAGQTTYQWMEDAANNGQSFTATTTGQNEYRVEVSNADGCISRDTINVTLNPKPVFNFSPSDTVFACASSFPINLDATTASASYEWNDMSTGAALDVNAQGDYWVIVTVNGCSDTDSVYVKESSTLSLDLGPDTTVCPGQSITLNPVVNYSNITYTWSDGSSGTTLNTNVAGKIYLDIQDQGGCSGVDTMELFTNNPLTIELGPAPTGLCIGDTADLELTPARTGLNYDWNDGTLQVSTDSVHRVWAEGTTTFTLNIDSAGCTASDDITITINSLPTVSLGTDTFVCQGAGATITLDAGAGQADYLWNDNSAGQTLDVGSAGDYNVSITDGNGCIARDTITVTEETATSVALTGGDVTICPAGSAVIALDNTSATATGATWVWTNDNSTNPAATYTVQNQLDGDVVQVEITYTNEFGCVDVETTTVTISNVLDVQGVVDHSLCAGESFSFRTDFYNAPNFNDYTYVWHDNTTGANFPVNNVTLGDDNSTISVVVTDTVNGCSGSASATLSVNPLPVPVLRDTATCFGTPVMITSQLLGTAHTFVWKKNNAVMVVSDVEGQTIDGLTTGVDTYEVVATIDATGCKDSASALVTTNALPIVNLGIPTNVCEGLSVTLPTSGNLYSTATHDHVWSLNGNVINGETDNTLLTLVDGTYMLTVTETATNCVNSNEVTLDFIAKPNVDILISSEDTVICSGSTASMEASELNSNYHYNWYFSATGTDIGAEVTSALDEERITDANTGGTYALIVTPKQANCPDTATAMISVREHPVSGIQGDSVVCFEEMQDGAMVLNAAPINLNRGMPTYHFNWSTGDTTQLINITQKGTYTVVITDEEGCSGEGEVTMSEDCMPNVWVANAFTPNGDAMNDVWGIEGRGLESIEVFVFNRWGEQVWKGTSVNEKWDGTFGGSKVAEDVYVWVLSYSFFDVQNNEQTRNQTGIVSVVR